MKRSVTSLSIVLCTALAFAIHNSTSKAQVAARQGAIKGAITISKAVPSSTPAPSAITTYSTKLAKKPLTPTTQTKTAKVSALNAVSTGTNTPYDFSIESGFWPAGVSSVSATVKCYQVTSLSNGTTPSITLSSTQLPVFPNGATSYSMTLTPGNTNQVNLNFPTSTAGMQLTLIITGSGFDDNGDPFNFTGHQGVVVNP